jgi:peptidoglycan/xylan/chitin deacetylase (PgdA/CDA1 family)
MSNTSDTQRGLRIRKPFKFLGFATIIVGLALLISFLIFSFLKLNFRLEGGFVKISTDNTLGITDNNYLIHDISRGAFKSALADNFGIDYDVEPLAQGKNTVRIPVLTYHHVDDLSKNPRGRDYYVSPKIFEEQLAYLASKNYKTLTTEEFLNQLKSGQNPTQKSVMLTFDDGSYDNYKYAYPLLVKYGFVGVFYVPSNKKGISNTQLKEMSDAGMIVDPHGKTHMLLSKITDPTLLFQEITESKTNIEKATGKKVLTFCYPGCEYNGAVTSTLSSSGYQLAFTCGRNIDHKIARRFTLERLHVYNDMNHFKSILSGKTYYPAYSD